MTADAAQTVDALSKSVLDLDASRRVGWARAYEASSREDDALRDLNIARSDLALLTRFAAYAFGVLQQVGAEGPVSRRYPKLLSFLPDAARRTGFSDATDYFAKSNFRREDAQEARERRRQLLKNENSRLYKNARSKERRDLMRQFHIPNEQALLDWLAQYHKGQAQ